MSSCAGAYADGSCRCVVCARCEQHTGNSNQGHSWRYCKVTRSLRDFHFCCPDDCELSAPSDGRTDTP